MPLRLLFVSELGPVLLDERGEPVSKFPFAQEKRGAAFLASSSGSPSQEEISWLKTSVQPDDVVFAEPQLFSALSKAGLKTEELKEEQRRNFTSNKLQILVRSGLASSLEEAENAIRDVSLELSDLRIREQSSSPDLQAIQSVQALDEVDKTANIMSGRVREWYGLHFPEAISMVDDNPSLLRLILHFKTRSNYNADELEEMGYSKNKSRAIETAAKESRGAELREEDIARIVQLSEEAQHLFSLRDKLASHVERTMRQVAPNLTEIAGATIGARLLSKAGGLDRLGILPASTIQILGAERALYRALKSGARPPKHGILFQHAEVHSAPKWQRGKIARSVAGKIAIAARVDRFRGTKDDRVLKSLQSRLDEIRSKYKEAPAPHREEERPPKFAPERARRFERQPPQRQREERQRHRGGRDRHGGKQRRREH